MATLNVWDGSAWVPSTKTNGFPKVWDGSAWVQIYPKVWYGSAWNLATSTSSTITVGTYTNTYKGTTTTYYGYDVTLMGSLSPTTYFSAYGTGTIYSIYYHLQSTSVVFNSEIQSNDDSNFTSIQIGSTTYLRSDATYLGGQWSWSDATNRIGTSGTQTLIINGSYPQ
jgi:hypothetical protein